MPHATKGELLLMRITNNVVQFLVRKNNFGVNLKSVQRQAGKYGKREQKIEIK